MGWIVGLKRQGQENLFVYGGYADWPNSIPMTSNKVFKIGSVTKLITSILILQLVEQKKISLNDSIRKFLPELPTVFNDIKITSLLNHTAGLEEYVEEKSPGLDTAVGPDASRLRLSIFLKRKWRSLFWSTQTGHRIFWIWSKTLPKKYPIDK